MWSNFNLADLLATTPANVQNLPEPQLDIVMLFGFLAMFATITCAVTPHASRNKLLVFAICLACCSVYGFLQGAWPLGIVEMLWAGSSLHRWHTLGREQNFIRRNQNTFPVKTESESRIGRIFGSK